MSPLPSRDVWAGSARDTSPEAAAVQILAWRRMEPRDRLRLALDLSDVAHQLALDGLRVRHPDDSLDQLLKPLTSLR